MPDYTNLINKGGTIYDTQTGTGFASEAELRKARNITGPTQWGQIAKNDAYTPQAPTPGTWDVGYAGSQNQPIPTPGDLGGSTLPSELKYGEVVDDTGNIAISTNADSSLESIETEAKSLQDAYIKELQSGRKEDKTFLEGIIKGRQKITEDAPDRQQIYDDTLKKYGYTPESFQKATALKNELADYAAKLNQIDALADQKIIAAEQETAPLAYTQGKAALIRRQAAAEKKGIAADAAVAEMRYLILKGDLDKAEEIADKAIENELADYKQNLADFDAFANLYGDYIGTLGEDDQKIIEAAYKFNQDALTTRRAELNENKQLVRDAAKYGIDVSKEFLTMGRDEFESFVNTKIATQARIDNTTGTTTTDKLLTPAEAKSFGVPYGSYRSEVEGTIPGQLPENAPGWFIQRENQKAGVSLTPQNLGVLWTEYKTAQESKNNIASAWSIF